MKRLATLSVLLLALALLCPALTTAQTGATVVPDHVALSWTDNPATSMAVTWRTDTTVTTGVVEYAMGAKLTATAKHVNATCSSFSTDLGESRIFRANMIQLAPNTSYTYRVGDGQHWSATHTFTTASAKTNKVKFIVFGDSQSIPPYTTWQTTLHNAYKANPDAKFFVNVGDLVDIGQNGPHWNAWFDAVAGVIDTLPAMPVIGNHETAPGKGDRKPAYWLAQFSVPQNGPDKLKGQAYSYNYGPVHIAVLDSQGSEEKAYGDILTPQAAWLDADLAAAKSTWKIAFFHKAPYEVHVTRKSKDVKDAFCPVLEKQHADLVFNGHDHGVARTYPMKDSQIQQKPSQGTVYCLCGRSGTKFYKDIEKKSWDAFFYNPLDEPNYQVVEVDGKKLTVTAYKQDGTFITSFTIDKAKDTDSDCAAM